MFEIIEAQGNVIGVFENKVNAQDAIQKLKDVGFNEAHIGIAAPVKDDSAIFTDASAESAGVGAAAGLGAGALWGLGVVAGVLPGIGPAIAGGALAAILSSAAVGAGTAGLVGALIGLGFSDVDAQHVDSQIKAGRIVVSVKAGDRADAAREILERFRWIEHGAPQVMKH